MKLIIILLCVFGLNTIAMAKIKLPSEFPRYNLTPLDSKFISKNMCQARISTRPEQARKKCNRIPDEDLKNLCLASISSDGSDAWEYCGRIEDSNLSNYCMGITARKQSNAWAKCRLIDDQSENRNMRMICYAATARTEKQAASVCHNFVDNKNKQRTYCYAIIDRTEDRAQDLCKMLNTENEINYCLALTTTTGNDEHMASSIAWNYCNNIK